VPILSNLDDFALLDDFINRYAPAGEFMAGSDFGHLHDIGVGTVGRALSLHLGSVLVATGLATWVAQEGETVVLQSKKGLRIPIEGFVQERLLLGASGDNFTSLESLIAEIRVDGDESASGSSERSSWWRPAKPDEIKEFQTQAEWARGKLLELGADVRGSLRDLEEIDRIIEHNFEPGGVVQDVAKPILGNDVERFVVGLGLFLGTLIAQFSPSTWFTHELPEGFSLEVQELGRIFPVARIQRRIYLSSAADATAKLSSFAFGVAAASISQRIRAGVYRDRPHVVTAFREMLPQVSEFSESELEGVVNALFERIRSL
jgi:hypothetical protein